MNGASFAGGSAPIAPFTIVAVFGTNLATGTLAAPPASPSAPALPQSLGGTQVLFNGIAAPLFFVSPGQVNALVPQEVSGSTANVQVLVNGAASLPLSVKLALTAPGIFTTTGTNGLVTHGATNGAITSSNPALPGEVVTIYCTGLGAVTNSPPDGDPASSFALSHTLLQPTVTVSGLNAPVSFSGLTPGFAGLYQVNAQIPQGISATGNVPLQILIGGQASNSVSVAVGSNGTSQYNLSVTDAGAGSGTVTSTPSGISCGSACSAAFSAGTSVTLTAAPAAGSTFGGWSGACTGTAACVIVLNSNSAVTATFNLAANPLPLLVLGMSAAPNPVLSGGSVAYTLTVQNNGSASAQNVTISDSLPTQLTFVSCTASAGSCTHNGNAVTANLGTLAAGGNATVTINATVASVTASTTITNTATVSTTSTQSSTQNNQATNNLTVSVVSAALSTGIITTVAGGEPVFTGAGGPAASATFGLANGVATDHLGNVYFSDFSDCIVAKVNSAGIISLVAGNGVCSYSGDGGPATSAALNEPAGLAIDASGNVYIADSLNDVIRKVSPTGIISTVAGNGTAGFTGDGGSALNAELRYPLGVALDSAGNLYIADTENSEIRKLTPSGIISAFAGNASCGDAGDGGPATSAQICGPRGVAVDAAGNVYIGDSGNAVVRKVVPGGTISTIAGMGYCGYYGDGGPATSADLCDPQGVAVDSAGNVYVAEYDNDVIRKISSSGTITTLAGSGEQGFAGDGGPATNAFLNFPLGVAVDTSGNVFIADFQNRRVRKVSSAGVITTLAGQVLLGNGGPATLGTLSEPGYVIADAGGNLYIADTNNDMIRKVSAAGTITTIAGNGTRGFSGDGGPATSAMLSQPGGLALDSQGNLYIADVGNVRVRKVTPGGIISTMAGNGTVGYAGDGGPAVNAQLSYPESVFVDSAGNLYIADNGNERIRKVTPAGTITTIAGSGQFSASGDGGPATSAGMDPTDLKMDGSGNLYVSDWGNSRVRMINSAGIISTIAGTGTAGYNGDGGAATSAELDAPSGLALDASGNLYIADAITSVVRKVIPAGTITTVAGAGYRNYTGDGGPATSAALFYPLGVATDQFGNVYIADSLNNRIRKVLLASVSAPTLVVSPASLAFTATAGSPNVSSQQLLVSSSVSGLAWTAQGSLSSGSGWLSATPASGTTPGTVAVTVNAATLAAGTYNATVTVAAPAASPNSVAIPVKFTVTSAAPTQLSVQPVSLSFQGRAGSPNPPSQALSISNPSGTSLQWSVSSSAISGGNWLSFSATSGTTGASSSSTQVSVNVAGLQAGNYQATITVSSSTAGISVNVPVTLLVAAAAQQSSTILLSQTSLSFTGVQGGSLVPSQSFGILNIGAGLMNWAANASTQTGGNWLSTFPTFGSSAANSLQIPTVTVSVDATGLKAGVYSGWVEVIASGAINTPQYVTVKLNVLPPGSNPGVLVRPTGLIFATFAGTTSPSSQSFNVSTAQPGGSYYHLSTQTLTGQAWLQAGPGSVTIAVGQAQTVSVQPALLTLAPGVYKGAVNLLFQDGSSQNVAVTFLIASSGASVQRAGSPKPAGAGGCFPTQVLVQERTLGSSFTSAVSYGQQIEAQVQDDCGNPITNANVIASFSSGDPTLALNSLQNGIYSATWNPSNPGAQVTVTVTAYAPPLQQGIALAFGGAQANPTSPFIVPGGVVNGASYAKGAALAPGAMVSIFGANLAQGSQGAGTPPLQSTLAGATVTIGGKDVPLFFASSGQINAQLPFGLTPNSQTQVIVRTVPAGGSAPIVTVPEPINIGSAAPGIFTIGANGQGQVINANTSVFAAPAGSIPGASAAPAVRGQYISIFCTGLGAVNNPPPDGTVAGSSSTTISMPTVTIGGSAAAVTFSGLAPGFVGLNQVNAQVPANIAPGNAVPLSLTINGAVSNTVTIAVQ